MTNRSFDFPLRISRQHGLKAAELFAAIGGHYPADGHAAEVTQTDLADLMQVSKRTVSRRINDAIAAGWLDRKEKNNADRFVLQPNGRPWTQGQRDGAVWVRIPAPVWASEERFIVKALIGYTGSFPVRAWSDIARDLGISTAALARARERAIDELGWLEVHEKFTPHFDVELPADLEAPAQPIARVPLSMVCERWPDLPPDVRSVILRLTDNARTSSGNPTSDAAGSL